MIITHLIKEHKCGPNMPKDYGSRLLKGELEMLPLSSTF